MTGSKLIEAVVTEQKRRLGALTVSDGLQF